MKKRILLNQNDTVFFLTHFLKTGKEFPLSDEYYYFWSREDKQKLVHKMCGGDTYRSSEQDQKLLQMLLLHDEIIFPYGVLNNVDIAAIKNYFKVTVLDKLDFIKEYKLNYFLEESTKEEDPFFVAYMKPAILNFLVEEFGEKYYIKKGIYSIKEFMSYMIDFAFGKEMILDDEYYRNIKENAELFVTKAYKPFYIDNPKNIFEKVDAYLGEFYQDIYDTFYRVLWEVKLSNDNDCLLYNSYYDIQYLGIDMGNFNSRLEENIYNNIKININDKIKQLPRMMTFEELLRIKDKHRKDIKRLRQVITELEQCVVLEGDIHLAEQIAHDLELAVKDLNGSEILSTVSTIATYAAVPIGIAETILSVFPAVGITVGVVGAATTAASRHFIKQNNWLNIVR